jgi:glycyl-tRNA synthetase beta chain
VPIGRITRGHRFLAPGEISVGNAAAYREKLAGAHVVLDRDERRTIIARDLKKLADAEGLTVKPDEGLLEEVTGLVEYPVVLMGSIDADFVRPLPEGLPPEVLATAMRTHQKYFTCFNADGSPAPRFLFVANNVTPDGGKTIAAGNERVLRARLSDARFFWDQDRKIRLEDRVEALKQRVYHEKLGSVYDKVERMEKLAGFLADQLGPQFVTPAKAGAQGQATEQLPLDSRLRGNDEEKEFKERCIRAARLAKADLSTGMVGEFPELQGIMGRYYALNDGEDPRVADAIAGHYKPLGPNDTCPIAPESIVPALADKIDALVAFFAIIERPTGSRDPFALRRAGLGLLRLVLENNVRLSLAAVFGQSYRICCETGSFRSSDIGPFGSVDPTDELLEFVAERLKVHLREAGIRHDLIAAVFGNRYAPGSLLPSEITASIDGKIGARSSPEDDLVRLIARVGALKKFLDSDDGASLLTAYRRASNIVSIEERRDKRSYDQPFDFTLQKELAEEQLYQRLSGLDATLRPLLAGEDFNRVMGRLVTLRQPVDEFFEHVTVNVPEKNLRENRLRLLARIRATMNQVADFSQIEG